MPHDETQEWNEDFDWWENTSPRLKEATLKEWYAVFIGTGAPPPPALLSKILFTKGDNITVECAR